MMRDVYKPYLTEWLSHHRSMGVDHFFIYDHGSDEPLARTLRNEKDVSVELILGAPTSTYDPHKTSYLKFLAKIQSGELPHYDRVAFIDEDEFIICTKGNLKDTLNNYLAYPAIGISWRIFGSSGLIYRTPDPQKTKFTKYTGIYYHANINMKSIVNPYLVKDNLSPHSFSYYFGNCVNEHGIAIPSHYTYPSYSYIWINHYWTRSKDEFEMKARRGMVETGEVRNVSMFDEVDAHCTESTV